MNFKLKELLTMAIIIGGASHALADSEAYVEVRKAEVLMELKSSAQGKFLSSVVTLEEESILALDIVSLNKTIELQKRNPTEVNYLLKNSAGEMKMTVGGVFCGVRIVDVPDDELRETEVVEREDLCITLRGIRDNTIVMEGNLPEIASAMLDVQKSDNNILLADLSVEISEKEAQILALQEAGIELVAKGAGFVKPLDGKLKATSEFGMRKHPNYGKRKMHKGIDLRASSGSNVKSALPGRVLATKAERNRKNRKLKGYGYYVIVVHPDKKMQTLYAHLSSYKSKAGQKVAAGERIALSGATGIGTGPHLHFETHVGSKAVNPRTYIKQLLAEAQLFFEKFFSLA